MLHLHLVTLALVASALAASGCGGSSKAESTTSAAASTPTAGTTTTTSTTASAPSPSGTPLAIASGKPLTRTVWIAKGDAICAQANAQLDASKVDSTAQLTRVLPQAAAYDRLEATKLSQLIPPRAMAADWLQIVTGFQKFSEYTTKVAEYAEANNFAAGRPYVNAGRVVHEQLSAIAKRDGFKACAVV